MQKAYCFISNYIYGLTSRLSRRTRNTVLFLCCFALMVIYVFFHIKSVMVPGKVMIIGSVITSVMILASIDGESEKIRWNRSAYLPMVLFGAGVFLVGLLHSVGDGFVVFPADLVVVFPFFYYVWLNRGDHESLYMMMASSALILGIISFIYCFFLAGKGKLVIMDGRIAGHMGHPNFLGSVGAVLFMSCIFILSKKLKHLGYAAVCSLGLGIGITYVALSGSRTAMLSEISSLVVAVVFIAKTRKETDMTGKDVCIRLVIMLAAVIFATWSGMKLDDINYRAISSGDNNTGGSMLVQTVYAEDADPGEEQTGEGVNPLLDRFDPSDGSGDLNAFGSGRLMIWKIYADNLSWFGRPPWEIKEQLKDAPETRAHNNFLEYFYRCGYIVGSFYVFFYVAIGIAALKRFFSRKYSDPGSMFLVMVVFTYMIYALIEIAYMPFTRIVPCLFFLSIAPLMGEKTE